MNDAGSRVRRTRRRRLEHKGKPLLVTEVTGGGKLLGISISSSTYDAAVFVECADLDSLNGGVRRALALWRRQKAE